MAEQEERILLGGCLHYGPGLVLELFASLDPVDFWSEQHGCLARVLIGLAQNGLGTDAASVLMKWGELGTGPVPHKLLAELPDLCPTKEAAALALEGVSKASRRRRMILAAAHATEALQDPSKSESEALAGLAEVQVGQRDVVCRSPQDLAQILVNRTQERYDTRGQLQGIATGLARLDRKTEGLQKGELFVMGARPSQGKSAIAVNIGAHVAFRLGIPVLFVSLEMSDYALARRLAACQGEVSLAGLRSGELTAQDFSRFQAFSVALAKSSFHLAYAPGIDSGRLSMLIRQYVGQYGVEVVVVDYLQQIRAVGRHEKRTYEVGAASTALKAAAVRNNVAVLAPCQLGRGSEKDNRPPVMSDLADSSQIERDADVISLIHFPDREEEPERAVLIIAKQRDGEVGLVRVRWRPEYVRFEDEPIST
jgi:replicative DNA helicase